MKNSLLIISTGFSRVSLPWFAPDDVIDYIIDALIFVAEEGWKFMVHYDINLDTAEWKHVSKLKSTNSFSLEKISYEKGFFEYKPRKDGGKNVSDPKMVRITKSFICFWRNFSTGNFSFFCILRKAWNICSD